MEALTTLGLGEIRPKNGLLRSLVPFESIIGLALVTASVSWIVLIYPALARLRCLIYYFSAYDDRGALPAALTFLDKCAREFAADDTNKRLRLAGEALDIALDELSELIASRFLDRKNNNRTVVFDLYRKEHLVGEAKNV